MKDFDLLNVPLEGTSLIEASAGTGKSFSIAGLFLRLVLEKKIPVHEILVVTFTKAATEELRDRVRKTLRDAQEAFAGGACRNDFIRKLVERHQEHEEALGLLNEAIRDFDRAAIMTIHGFCWRVLKENAFESLSMLDMKLLSSQEAIKSEIVDDFWRKHLYGETPLFVHFALRSGFLPDSLLSLLGNRISQPFLKVIPEGRWVDVSPAEREFLDCFEALESAWPSAREEVCEALTHAGGLKKNCYHPEKIPAWIGLMDGFLSRPQADSMLFPGFEKFTTTQLCRSVKKNCSAPAHPFFDLCDRLHRAQETLLEAYGQKILWLRAELFRFARAELSGRKRKRNVVFFDDLLLNLLTALRAEPGRELADTIHNQYRAGLIDEFQDTDPLQYAMFREVFAQGPSILFLIGDPKQSIYGFRGADLFAYMEAAKDVEKRFTLRENYRSSPGLIHAINLLFGANRNPFVYEEIRFHACSPAGGRTPPILSIDSKPQTPFHFWVLDSEEPKGIPKAEARKAICAAVAGEISRLLGLGREKRALLGAKPLVEEDIAVLVRRNSEAFQMQKSLSRLQIPSVLYSTGNLFESHEAREIERLLSSILEPEKGSLLRAALTTDLLGLKAEDLQNLIADENEWDEWVVRFRQYRELWMTRGFMRMLRQFLEREKVLSRLMRFQDGERRCTNLLHLAELLHQASVENRLMGSVLLKWLSTRRSGGAGLDPEEHPIRLESDEKAVKLVTVHKSKGLEYPIVFYPFGWDGSRLRNTGEPFTFHAGDSASGLSLDLGSEHAEENRRQAEKENLAENLRLLYVSLTRAKAGCTFVWGRFNEAETSAPAYLLYPPAELRSRDVVGSTRENYNGLGKEFTRRLNALEERSEGALLLEPFPSTCESSKPGTRRKGASLTCRQWKGNIDREQRFTSFSSLVSGQGEAEPFDHDRAEITLPLVEQIDEPRGFFSFPGGTRTGSFAHSVFENIEFTSTDPAGKKKVIRDHLLMYGFEPAWEDEVYNMVYKVMSSPLDPNRPDLRFCRVGREDRLHELEFYWPLKRITSRALGRVLKDYDRSLETLPAAERIEALEFSPVRGFMRGFVDLLFRFNGRYYLVDWKSNDLGPAVEHYDQAGMGKAMLRGHYVLQYLIYTVAVHQFLRLRLPGYRYETHFGGVFYIFLRGVDPARGADFGIFRARPSEEFVQRLAAELVEE